MSCEVAVAVTTGCLARLQRLISCSFSQVVLELGGLWPLRPVLFRKACEYHAHALDVG